MSLAPLYQLASRISALEAGLRDRSSQLAHSTIEGGVIIETDELGAVVASYGTQFDGSHMAAEHNGPAPLQPSAPFVEGAPGGIKVRWDGLWLDSGIVPMNFTRVEIHIQKDVVPVGDVATTLYGTIESPRGGELSFTVLPGTYHVVLVARNLSGARGPASVSASGVATAVVSDEDLAAIDQAIIDINTELDGVPAQISTAKDEAIAAAALTAQDYADLAEADAIAASIPRTADSVTSTYIADNAVTTPKLVTNAVTADKILAGAVIAGKIAANAVVASNVAAFAIQTQHLAIADMSNHIPNGAGEYGTGTAGWLTMIPYNTTDKPAELRGVWKGTSTTSTTVPATTDWISVEAGEQLYFEFWAKANVANSRMYVEVRDQAGANLPAGSWVVADGENNSAINSSYPVGNLTIPTVWTKYGVIGTMPTGVTRVRIAAVYFNHSAGSVTNAEQAIAVRIRRRSGGKLIVDGSIIASKIAADAVTAVKIAADAVLARNVKAGEIVAGKLAADAVIAGNIAANAVTASTIAAGAVTAGKIQAQAIDGMVITGALFRTGASGARWELGQTGLENVLQAFTNAVGEIFPATIRSDNTNGGITIDGADFGQVNRSQFSISDNSTESDISSYADKVSLHAYKRATLTADDGETSLWLDAAPEGGNYGSPDSIYVQSKSTNGIQFRGGHHVALVAGDVGVGETLAEFILKKGGDAATLNTHLALTGSDGTVTAPGGVVSAAMRPIITTGASLSPGGAGTIAHDGHVFTAPPSGVVAVVAGCFVRASVAGTATYLSWELREGGTLGSGTVVQGPSTASGFGNYNTQHVAGERTYVMTGLTPGATYNIRMMAVTGAGGGSFSGPSVATFPQF